MTILLVLGICAAVVFVLLSPFRRSSSPIPVALHDGDWPAAGSGAEPGPGGCDADARLAAPREPPVTALLDEKDRIFQALADLRFDFEAGKLAREDFETEDARLRKRAAELLRDLEG